VTRILSAAAALALLASAGVAAAQTSNYSTNWSSNPDQTYQSHRWGGSTMPGSSAGQGMMQNRQTAALRGGQFANESEARARCGGDVVWMNTKTHVYHMAGSRQFGQTKHGAFMCRADADRAGRAAKNEMRAQGMQGSSGRMAHEDQMVRKAD